MGKQNISIYCTIICTLALEMGRRKSTKRISKEEPDDLFVEAMHNKDYIDYLIEQYFYKRNKRR